MQRQEEITAYDLRSVKTHYNIKHGKFKRVIFVKGTCRNKDQIKMEKLPIIPTDRICFWFLFFS